MPLTPKMPEDPRDESAGLTPQNTGRPQYQMGKAEVYPMAPGASGAGVCPGPERCPYETDQLDAEIQELEHLARKRAVRLWAGTPQELSMLQMEFPKTKNRLICIMIEDTRANPNPRKEDSKS